MAKIVEYNAPLADRGLNPSEKGINAAEGEAAGALSTGRQIAASDRQQASNIGEGVKAVGDVAKQAYQQFVVQPEISKGSALAATKQADLTQQWNAIAKNADPNDTSIAQKFQDDVLTPEMQKFKEGFNTADGKEFAEKEANRFTAHMRDKVDADMSTRAGDAIMVNLAKTKNNLTNMVRADPTSYDHAVALAESSIGTLTANSTFLSAEAANKVRTQGLQNFKSDLANAAIYGTAERSPKDAQALLDSGKFNDLVDGKDASAMIKTFTSAQRADADRSRVLKDRAEKDLSTDTREDYEKQIFSGDGSKVSVQQVWSDPKLQLADKEAITHVINGDMKKEATSAVSGANSAALFNRIHSTDPATRLTDTNEIAAAYGQQKINQTAYKFLTDEFTASRTSDGQKLAPTMDAFLKGMQSSITKSNPLMGKVDQSGDQQNYAFGQYVRGKVEEYRKAGKDPTDLFIPGKPDYLGTQQTLQAFQKPLADSLADQSQKYTGGSSNLTGPGNTVTGVQYGPVTNPATPTVPPSTAPTKPTKYPDAVWSYQENAWTVTRDGQKYKVKQ